MHSRFPPPAPTRGFYAGNLAAPSRQVFRKSFPIQAFRGLLGAMAGCLCGSGIDPAIVGATLMAFASLLTQGVANVVRSGGQRSPLSVPVYLVAPSASGKSDLFEILINIIYKILQDLKAELPSTVHPMFLMEEATREAIVLHLAEWPFAGLFTDESGQLDLLFRNAGPQLAKLLTAASLDRSRVTSGRVSLRRYRFTAFLGEQPHIFEKRKAQFAGGRGSVGWVNRFTLVQGLSFNATTAPELLPEVEARFSQRARELLAISVENACNLERELPIVRLDRLAAQYLEEVRSRPAPFSMSPELAVHASEYLARRAERLHKLAGVLHVLEHGPEGEISVETMQAADEIGIWSIESFLAMTYEPPKPTPTEMDAEVLGQALFSTGAMHLPLNLCRRDAVNLGLTKPRFDRALAHLASQRILRIVLGNKGDWIQLLSASDRLFLG